jgi:hypothetical protein
MKRSRLRTHRIDGLKRAGLLGLCGALLLTAGPDALWGQSASAQNECCLVLLIPVGARSVALGGTLTARSTPESVFGNPAGLAGLSQNGFFVHHAEQEFQSTADAFSLLLTLGRIGTLGLSYELFDHGEIETTDSNNQMTGVLAWRDHLGLVSLGVKLIAGLSAGASYKLFHSRIDCSGACEGLQVASTTNGVDLGVRYQPPMFEALELGASVLNAPLGAGVKEGGARDPLPTRIHLGATYEALHRFQAGDAISLWLSAELTDRWRSPHSPHPAFGAELGVQNIVFLRAGYVTGEGLGSGGAVGLGLHYESLTLSLGKPFANTSLDPDTQPYQVSFGVRF